MRNLKKVCTIIIHIQANFKGFLKKNSPKGKFFTNFVRLYPKTKGKIVIFIKRKTKTNRANKSKGSRELFPCGRLRAEPSQKQAF